MNLWVIFVSPPLYSYDIQSIQCSFKKILWFQMYLESFHLFFSNVQCSQIQIFSYLLYYPVLIIILLNFIHRNKIDLFKCLSVHSSPYFFSVLVLMPTFFAITNKALYNLTSYLLVTSHQSFFLLHLNQIHIFHSFHMSRLPSYQGP